MSGSSVLRPEELLAEYSWLQGLARSLVADPERADDAVQDACVRALSAAPRDRSRLRQWLSTILRNSVRQQARADRARKDREAQATAGSPQDEPTPPDLVARVALQQRTVALVLELPEAQRAAVLMRFFEGLPQREIARRQGVPVATVNSRLSRALVQIRGQLDREFGGDRRAWASLLAPLAGATSKGAAPALLTVLLMQAKIPIALAAVVLTGLVYLLWPEPVTSAVEPDGRVDRRNEPVLTGLPATAGAPAPAEGRARLPERDPDPASMAPAVVRGVVCFADGRPAPDIAVGVRGDAGVAAARSDAQGRFELAGAQPGAELAARDERYVTVLLGSVGSMDAVVVIAQPIAIRGQVVSTKGVAVDEARLAAVLPDDFETRLRRPLDRTRMARWVAESTADGRFALDRVPAVEGLRLTVTRSPFRPAERALGLHSDERVYIVLGEVRPEDGPALVGRVLDPEGLGVADALVATGLTTTVTDANGNFRVLLRRAGQPESIRALKAGFGPARLVPDVDTASGETRWPDFVELRLSRETKSIAGRVVDAAGEPVAGALVWTPDAEQFGVHGIVPVSTEYLSAGGPLPKTRSLPDAVLDAPLEGAEDYNGMWHAKEVSSSWFFVETDASGRFELPGLQDKDYRVRAMHKGTTQMTTSRPVAAGSAGVELALPGDGAYPEVTGRLVLPDGQPAAGVSISVFCNVVDTNCQVPGGRFRGQLIRHGRKTRTDADGRFRLADTPVRGSRLSLYADSIIPRLFAVPDTGKVTDLRIEVTPRLHLEVVLDDAARGDAIRGEDESGASTLFTEIRAGSMKQVPQARLLNGRSGVLVVPSQLRVVVLLKGGAEVDRRPVRLRFGEKCVVRF